jgi:hypothetical protein
MSRTAAEQDLNPSERTGDTDIAAHTPDAAVLLGAAVNLLNYRTNRFVIA